MTKTGILAAVAAVVVAVLYVEVRFAGSSAPATAPAAPADTSALEHRLDRIGSQFHFVFCENVTFPWFDAHGCAAAGKGCHDGNEAQFYLIHHQSQFGPMRFL